MYTCTVIFQVFYHYLIGTYFQIDVRTLFTLSYIANKILLIREAHLDDLIYIQISDPTNK